MTRLIVIMIVSFAIFLLLDSSSIIFLSCFFGLIMLILLGKKYFELITVSDNTVKIRRRNIFKVSEVTLDLSTINFELKQTASYKGGRFFLLEIRMKNQLKFSLDSRDGFNEAELLSFYKEVRNLREISPTG